MDNPRKIIILYASAGHGHAKAAQAILEAYQASESSGNAQALDTLSFAPFFAGNLYKQVYLLQIKYAPWLWGVFYYASDIAWIYFFLKPVRRFVNAVLAKRLEKFLVKEDASVIIATHFLATEVASYLKERGQVRSKLITLITDYLPHCVWTAKAVDFYVVALEETKAELVRRGGEPQKVKVLGIPVEQKFLKTLSKAAICEKLKIDGKIFTVLITSGGAGIGAVGRIAEGLLTLAKPVQVIVICGTNRFLFQRLEEASKKNPLLKAFGFVDNMEELMEASDLVIGKGGGLTITESLVRGRPILLFQSVPGQETRNAFLVGKYNAGYATRSVQEVVHKVSELLNFPDKLKEMKDAAQRMSKPMAARQIVELAQNER